MNRKSKGQIRKIEYPAGAGQVIGQGNTVMIVNGYARTVANVANEGVVGVNEHLEVDNSAGLDGDKTVTVSSGVFEFSGTFAATVNNAVVYADGAQTASATQTGNFPVLGRAVFVDTTKIDVMVGPEFSRA